MAQIDAIAAQAPQTQRLQLPACGHSPHRDHPLLVTQAIIDFLHRLKA
jgi:pimeloyl-ACP methyl ester carboxylesterase